MVSLTTDKTPYRTPADAEDRRYVTPPEHAETTDTCLLSAVLTEIDSGDWLATRVTRGRVPGQRSRSYATYRYYLPVMRTRVTSRPITELGDRHLAADHRARRPSPVRRARRSPNRALRWPTRLRRVPRLSPSGSW